MSGAGSGGSLISFSSTRQRRVSADTLDGMQTPEGPRVFDEDEFLEKMEMLRMWGYGFSYLTGRWLARGGGP